MTLKTFPRNSRILICLTALVVLCLAEGCAQNPPKTDRNGAEQAHKDGDVAEPGDESEAEAEANLLEELQADRDGRACEALEELARSGDQPDVAGEGGGETSLDIARAAAAGTVLFDSSDQTRRACLAALHYVRDASMEALIDVLEDEDAYIQQAIETRGDEPADWARERATIRQRAIVALNSLHPVEKASFFVEQLRGDPKRPDYLDKKTSGTLAWTSGEVFVRQYMILGLSTGDDPDATALLTEIVQGKFDERWSEILVSDDYHSLRSVAALTLAYRGDKSAADDLLAQAKEGPLQGDDRSIPAMRFDVQVSRAFSLLAGGDRRGELRTFAKSHRGRRLVGLLESHAKTLDLVHKCERSKQPEDRATCYGDALGSDNTTAYARALLELGRLPADAAAPFLAGALDQEPRDLSGELVLAIQRRPHPSVLEAVERRWARASEGDDASGRELDQLAAARAYLINALNTSP